MRGLLKKRPGPRNLLAPFRCLAILAIVFLASFAGVLRAQTQVATVFGTVTDPSGAVIPGAQITIANQSTDGSGTPLRTRRVSIIWLANRRLLSSHRES